MRGRSQGKYGESHKAAVALGLKAPANSATQIPTANSSRG
ncbi:hypothetical protein [Xanthomonas oryzae]|nr:hypothetical protein [Xanthomonas oryzae]